MNFLNQHKHLITLVVITLLLASLLFDKLFIHIQYAVESFADSIKISDLVTLVAAFAGSGIAFLLEDWRRKRSQKEIKLDALRKTAFLLSGQFNALKVLKKKYLEPLEKDELRWMSIVPLQPLNFTHLMIDVGQLHFLIKENPKFLLQLQIAQECFFAAIQGFNARNAFHVEEFQKKLDLVGVETSDLSQQMLEQLLGRRITTSLKVATDEVYESNKYATSMLVSVIPELHALSKDLFPYENFPLVDIK
jgi:hypothetical protein